MLKFEPGAVVTIPYSASSQLVWTINSQVSAGIYQIFNAPAGAISFSGNTSLSLIYPEWWGATANLSTDSSPAWNDAIIAAENVNGTASTVYCNGGYALYNTITSTNLQGGGSVPSIIGPYSSQSSGNTAACSLAWYGANGSSVYHQIGGYDVSMKGIQIGDGPSREFGKGVWLDSQNGGSTTSSSITSISRAVNTSVCPSTAGYTACVVTATLGTAQSTWASGLDIRVTNVTDSTYNGTFPIWYMADSTHAVYIQSGPVSSSSGGTISTASSNFQDLERYYGSYMQITPNGIPGISISSCTISTNILSCTLSAAADIQPAEWVSIQGSTDPVYNAYWQVNTVTGSTSFTAVAQEVTSEATTTSGTFYGQSTGMAFGTNTYALRTNSVCCSTLDHISVLSSGPTTGAISGFEFIGYNGNLENFSFTNTDVGGIQFGTLGSMAGTYMDDYSTSNNVTVAAYAGLSPRTTITNDEWESGPTAYFFASLVSGSYNASTLGPRGQFETCTQGIQNQAILIQGNAWEGAASDGVFISCLTNATIQSNIFVNANSATISSVTATGTSATFTYTSNQSLTHPFSVYGWGYFTGLTGVPAVLNGVEAQITAIGTNTITVASTMAAGTYSQSGA